MKRAVGAWLESRIGLRALVVSVGFAFIALVLAMGCKWCADQT